MGCPLKAGWISAISGTVLLLALGLNMGGFLQLDSEKGASPADVLVILGGGWEFREITGAEMFRRGLARRILITGPIGRRDARGYPLNMPAFDYLMNAGIPPDKIDLESSARNTWEEAGAIRDYLQKARWNSALIVTDPPHMRRLDWVCRRILRGSGIYYNLVSTRPDWWDAGAWWKNPISRRFVVLEYIKFIYYLIRYSAF